MKEKANVIEIRQSKELLDEISRKYDEQCDPDKKKKGVNPKKENNLRKNDL